MAQGLYLVHRGGSFSLQGFLLAKPSTSAGWIQSGGLVAVPAGDSVVVVLIPDVLAQL